MVDLFAKMRTMLPALNPDDPVKSMAVIEDAIQAALQNMQLYDRRLASSDQMIREVSEARLDQLRQELVDLDTLKRLLNGGS